jgi:hypothetical protein
VVIKIIYVQSHTDQQLDTDAEDNTKIHQYHFCTKPMQMVAWDLK